MECWICGKALEMAAKKTERTACLSEGLFWKSKGGGGGGGGLRMSDCLDSLKSFELMW